VLFNGNGNVLLRLDLKFLDLNFASGFVFYGQNEILTDRVLNI